jgi:hypothetical protein
LHIHILLFESEIQSAIRLKTKKDAVISSLFTWLTEKTDSTSYDWKWFGHCLDFVVLLPHNILVFVIHCLGCYRKSALTVERHVGRLMNVQCYRHMDGLQRTTYSYKLFQTVQLFLSKHLPLSSQGICFETDSCHEIILAMKRSWFHIFLENKYTNWIYITSDILEVKKWLSMHCVNTAYRIKDL